MLKRSNKIILGLSFSLLLILGYFIKSSLDNEEYIPSEYEIKLINYFKEVALQSEYDDNPGRIIKWKKPMKLLVIKEDVYKSQMKSIIRTLNQINKLATDGFKIELTNEISESNAILYLCRKEKVSELDPDFYKMLNDGIDYEISGLAYAEFFSEDYVIDKALIFINSEESVEMQESTILEEITQSIGLPYDPKNYPNSVFYQNKYEDGRIISKYSEIDTDIVRLLYHPKMKSGLNSKEVESVIKMILKSEKRAN